MTLQPLLSEFPYIQYEENFILFFIDAFRCGWPTSKSRRDDICRPTKGGALLCDVHLFSLVQYRGYDCSSFSSFFIAWHDRLASLSGYLHIYYVPPPPLPQMWWIGINWQAGVHAEYSHLLDIFSARLSPPPIFRILHKCLSRFKSLKWNNFRNFPSFQTSGPCSAIKINAWIILLNFPR
jgi:hypothetical protein